MRGSKCVTLFCDVAVPFMSKSFESSRAAEPVGAFPHARRVGDLLFLSGIGPRVRGSKEIPGVTLDAERNIVSYDIEKQCHAVFENVRLVLEDAGATWNDIVDVTVFLTNMKKDFAIFNRIYPEYFAGPGKPNPTRTTVEVGALPTPIAIELKVIAACYPGALNPAYSSHAPDHRGTKAPPTLGQPCNRERGVGTRRRISGRSVSRAVSSSAILFFHWIELARAPACRS